MKRFSKDKKIIALAMATSLLVASCGNTGDKKAAASPTPTEVTAQKTEEPKKDEIVKPDKISLFGSTIFAAQSDPKSWQPFVDEYKKRTGIELVYTKPPHNEYSQQLSLAFTTGNIPDIFEAANYPTYASNGVLWDMTDAWEKSELKASGIVEEKYLEQVKIDNKLYGFPMVRGGGTVTYVRQDWLDKLGMSAPTNYEEFTEMLRAFTEDDPDGNGKDDTYGLTMPGLVGPEQPYTIYAREYYQDAQPGFYQKDDGKWVDGMLEPEMTEALNRMRDHYMAGFLDMEVVTNKTSTCRDKFYAGQVGTFNYWAGQWNVTLQNNLTAQTPQGVVVPILPINETKYIERPSAVLSITTAAKNPEGIFKYMVEYSHDGGEGEMLFTRGVEGVNYEVKADGTAVALPDPENDKILYPKAFYSPELGITKTFEDPIPLDEKVVNSLNILSENSINALLPVTNEAVAQSLPDLNAIRDLAIANAVTSKDMTVEQALAQYEKDGRALIDNILAAYNTK